uniref:G_PROTEIN_RECEP_F1_2 domain-containing protein n=1 Tax=Heterorhabditis bacteriophora TaxID=37862 RepID=A0A1I7XCD0_HETBA
MIQPKTKPTVHRIPKDLRKFIYAFAVFNSAISPYLYGYFSFDVKKEIALLLTCSKATASDRHLSCSANIVRFNLKENACLPNFTVLLFFSYYHSENIFFTKSQQSQRIRKRSASACELDKEILKPQYCHESIEQQGTITTHTKEINDNNSII